MAYLAQTLVFLLALLGAFFKFVKEEDGKPIRTRMGMLMPTLVGWLIMAFLLMSFLLSLFATWHDAQEAELDRQNAAQTQQRLEAQLANLSNENERLNAKLSEANAINLQGFRDVLGEQEKKHQESLNRFSSLLTRQEEIGKTTARNINRTFNQFGTDLSFSLTYLIPANFEPLKSYAETLREPYVIRFEQGEKVTDTIRWVRVFLYFYKKVITPEQFERAKSSDLVLMTEFDFRDSETRNGIIAFLYKPKENAFSFTIEDPKPFKQAQESGIRSMDDFHGATSVIVIQSYESDAEFLIMSLILGTPGLPAISIEGYRLVSRDKVASTFFAKIK